MKTIYINSIIIHPIVIISKEELYILSELGFINNQFIIKWFKYFFTQIGQKVQLENIIILL
ncbi:hypothetical protein CJF32_00005448 [Rutstroemia sp. NJR-2017a WRK4]|nr:hypothetical protein CJF32_00005448 [Rutstroemia sp. NJR-2017a WRK4]